MDATVLQDTWFGLLLLFLIAYSVFDGFDLGVGMLTLFTKSVKKGAMLFSSLAPFWDGNELWLVIAGASLFAVFPKAYATAFSGLYVPVFLVALSLMLRAAAFECRHLCRRTGAKRSWERVFAAASFLIPFLLAVALGNSILGLPLSKEGNYSGGLLLLFRPYPLALAVCGIAMVLLQGALFAAGKLPLPFSDELRTSANRLWYFAAVAFGALAVVMLLQVPAARTRPLFWFAGLAAAALLVATRLIARPAKEHVAFLAASGVIVAIWLMQAAGLFPALIRDSIDASNSITIFNGSSGITTLRVLARVAVPSAILYLALNWYLYATFRGKLAPDKDLYGDDQTGQ